MGLPCRLIATSLVEAGVGFHSDRIREMAGVESMIQAAGRCNREGKRAKEDCVTTIFTLENAEELHIPQSLRLPVSVAHQVAEKQEDIASLEAIADYFNRLYHFRGESLDSKKIIEQMEAGGKSFLFPFAAVAEQFRLIENNTRIILIDRDPEAEILVGAAQKRGMLPSAYQRYRAILRKRV